MKSQRVNLYSYRFPLILLGSILLGCILGIFLNEDAEKLKPLGDLFLNAIFTIVVPLVFFSLSSVVANMGNLNRLGKITGAMMTVFVITGILASVLMISVVINFPPADGVEFDLTMPDQIQNLKLGEQMINALTVSSFLELFSRESMLALIIAAIFFGVAVNQCGEKGKPVAVLLSSASEVLAQLVKIVMYYAPVGLGAYFASVVGTLGPEIIGNYGRAIIIYYPVAIIYFVVGFSIYAYLAEGWKGIGKFWRNCPTPAMTSLATSSSVAAIPANLQASRNMGVSTEIRDVVIPMGAQVHMDGSALGAILKISFLFGLFHKEFTGIETYVTAIAIALLSGIVMSGVLGGGFVAEMLIVTMYGFPLEALPILAVLGTLIDPPATMINATGDSVTCMLINRMLGKS